MNATSGTELRGLRKVRAPEAPAFAQSPRGSGRARRDGDPSSNARRGTALDLPTSVCVDRLHPEGDLGCYERDFRARYHERDRRLVQGAMAVVGSLAALLLAVRWITVGYAQGGHVAAMTALIALICGLAYGAVSGQRVRATIMGGAVVWYLVVCGALGGIMLLGPPRIIHAEVILFLLATLVLLPIGVFERAVPAAALTAAASWNARLSVEGQPELVPLMIGEIVVLVATLALGLWYSMRSRRELRERFLAELRLAASRRESAELARLIPVCAYCRQVRSDDAFWEDEGPALERRRILSSTPVLCAPCADEAASADDAIPAVADAAVEDRVAAPEPAREAVAEDAAPPAGCVGWWRRSIDPDLGELEAEFRDHHRQADRSAFAVFATLVMVFMVANIARGFAVQLDEVPVVQQGVRVVIMLLTGGALLAVLRLDEYRHRDRVLFAWALMAAVAASGFMLLGARGAPATTPLLLIVALYLILPVPLWMRAGAALLCTLLTFLLVEVQASTTGTYEANLFVALVVVNVIGLFAARAGLAASRATFLAGRGELEEIERLEQLEELLPMCTSCGHIRDDDGYWTHVFEYLREHTDYRASHGICPDCLAVHHADLVEECDDDQGVAEATLADAAACRSVAAPI